MAESPIGTLGRWEHHGAVWRVVHVSDEAAIVDLCTCSGEPVERLESREPAVVDYVRSRGGGPGAGPTA